MTPTGSGTPSPSKTLPPCGANIQYYYSYDFYGGDLMCSDTFGCPGGAAAGWEMPSWGGKVFKTGDPAVCAQKCCADPGCAIFTVWYRPIGEGGPLCFLKGFSGWSFTQDDPNGPAHTSGGLTDRIQLAPPSNTRTPTQSPTPSQSAVPQTGCVTVTVAGAGSAGSADGLGTNAAFNNPSGAAVSHTGGGAGNIVVADMYNCVVRSVTPLGLVTTLSGVSGCDSANLWWDGAGATARFYWPSGVVVDVSFAAYLRTISAPPTQPPHLNPTRESEITGSLSTAARMCAR
jgi:hypothetical protein